MKNLYVFVILFIFFEQTKADCNIINITQWGDSPNLRTEKLQEPVKLVIVQHTATKECNSDQECVERMKEIRDLQKDKYHFIDIGNSFFISGHGNIYEGAGWSLVGAHTKNYNSKSIGVTFIGNFECELPTEAAQTAFNNLVTCGISNKHLTDNYTLAAHSQLTPTLSPGEKLREAVKLWPHWQNISS